MALNNLGLGILVNVAGNAAGQLSKISSGFRDVTNAAKEATKTTRFTGRSFVQALGDEKIRSAMTSAGTAMVGLGVAASSGAGGAIKVFGDFQQQMLNLKAAAGLTAEQYKELTDFALELGAATKFSASQTAQAMYEIASAGITSTEDIKNMTIGVSDFASAGGIDLPKAAATMVSAMKAFQIDAKESTHVADVFSQAIRISSFRADEFELALAQAGGVANMVGQSLEQTVAGLMALRNAGISASDGATSLKTALMMLINPTGEAEAMMNQLGIQVRDAQGNMKSWPEIVAEFEKAFANSEPVIQKFRNAASMTQEELEKFAEANHLTMGQLDTMIKAAFQGEQAFKEVAMATIFGQDGIRAMATALNAQAKVMRNGREVILTGSEALKEWERQLVNSKGVAADMAKTMNSGINFAIEEMLGSIESASIMLGNQLEPTVRSVTKTIGQFADWFSNLPQPMQRFVANTLVAVSAGGLFGGILLLLITRIPSMVQGLKLAYQGFMLMGRGIRFVTTGSWQALRVLWLHTSAIMQNTWAATVNSARWLAARTVMLAVRGATLLWAAAQWALNAALSANPIGLVVVAIGALVAAIVWAWNNVEWFRDAVLKAVDWIVGGFKRITNWFAGLPGWVQAAIAVFMPFLGIPMLLINNWESVKTFFRNLPDQIMGFLADLPARALEFGKNFAKMIGDGIANGVEYVKEKVSGVAQKIKDFLGFSSPTKYGPGADADKWMPNMISMLARGLDRGASVVGMSAARIAQAARDELAEIDPTITPPAVRPVASPLPAGAARMTRPILTYPQPEIAAQEAAQTPTAAPQQSARAAQAGPVQQIIQLVVDGQVLAQIIANIQGENAARAAAY